MSSMCHPGSTTHVTFNKIYYVTQQAPQHVCTGQGKLRPLLFKVREACLVLYHSHNGKQHISFTY